MSKLSPKIPNATRTPAADKQRRLEQAIGVVRDAQESAFFGTVTFHFQSGKLTLVEERRTTKIP